MRENADHTVEPAARRARLLAAAADCSHDAIFAIQGDGTIAVASVRASHILGLDASELEGRSFASLFDDPARSTVEEHLRTASAGGDVFQHDTVALHPAGPGVEVTLNMAPLRAEDGSAPGGVSVIVQEITSRKAHERELRAAADHDDPTGMSNRRHFVAALERMLPASGRRSDREAALLVLDADHLKQVNDGAGHLAGDNLLRALAQTFEHRLRTTDLAARLGGDEFAVLATSVGRADALRAAEKLHAATGAALAHWNATTSIGLVHFSEAQTWTIEDGFETADRRLYRAKAAGGNAVTAS